MTNLSSEFIISVWILGPFEILMTAMKLHIRTAFQKAKDHHLSLLGLINPTLPYSKCIIHLKMKMFMHIN